MVFSHLRKLWQFLCFPSVHRKVTDFKIAFLVLIFISILWSWTIFTSSHGRVTLILSSANAFDLDQPKILSFGNELKRVPKTTDHGTSYETIRRASQQPFTVSEDQDQNAQYLQSDLKFTLSGREIRFGRHFGFQAETVRWRLPLIYLITPTYERAEQKAELTRLSYTLRHVERLHWIVIEDATNKTSLVTWFLRNCKVPYTHLCSKTLNISETIKSLYPPQTVRRGALQRNTGLDWLYAHAELPSVVYFADDDNTYDLQLFEEMRYTTKVSVWPVGLVGQVRFETPAVKDGKVVRWIVGYKPARKFAIDMAGFAVNTGYLLRAGKPYFSRAPFGTLLEADFLDKLNITMDDFEPKADNCSKVLVWHTKAMKTQLSKIEDQKPYLRNYSIPDMEV